MHNYARIRALPTSDEGYAALESDPIRPRDYVWCFTDDGRMYLAVYLGVKVCGDPDHVHVVVDVPRGAGPFSRN